MTDEEVEREKSRQWNARYDQSDAGKARRVRDNERIKRGYRALRAMGVSCKEALKGARKAARALAEKEGAEHGRQA